MPDGIATGHFDPYTFNLAAASTPGEVYDLWTLMLASGKGDVLGALRQVFARVRREVREAWFEREFPDIVAEFNGSIEDEDLELDAEPEPGLEEDDYGLGSGCTSFEYRCTVQELEEGGYGGGFSEVDLGGTPEHEPEFIEAQDEEPNRPRDLLDSAERWHGLALPGLTRAAGAFVDEMCDRCPLEAA
jgi:hypothetical protein